MKSLLKEQILIPAIKRLYQIDYQNIQYGVSERNICARLAHHIENIMREYDQQHKDRPFNGYYADVEYNRMGNGEQKHYENREHGSEYMVSDLLIQNRGYERNLLAIEMKKKGNYRNAKEDRERLASLVSSGNTEMNYTCVHDTILGAFVIYSKETVVIEYYENVSGVGEITDREMYDTDSLRFSQNALLITNS